MAEPTSEWSDEPDDELNECEDCGADLDEIGHFEWCAEYVDPGFNLGGGADPNA